MNNKTTLELYLKEHGSLTYTFKGTSMNPLLKQGRDLYTVIPKTADRCEKYDVVLYRRPESQQYVLHRIMEVRDSDYVILGDNCMAKEYGIRDDDIIGVMSSFCRKGKTIHADDLRYRLYIFIWMLVHPCLIFLKRIRRKLASGIRRNLQ